MVDGKLFLAKHIEVIKLTTSISGVYVEFYETDYDDDPAYGLKVNSFEEAVAILKNSVGENTFDIRAIQKLEEEKENGE